MGEPVKLNMDDSKKKLVISLFVDGLAQVVLKEENLEILCLILTGFF